MFKILVIATNHTGRPSMKVLEFDWQQQAEAAFSSLTDADQAQTHTKVLPIRLYKAVD